MEELIIQTEIGLMTAIFEYTPINCFQTMITAYFKEKPEVIIESYNIHDAIDELHDKLKIFIEIEKNIL
jgi:hypothetical protein